jgi:putative FmdB family regulatory protein
MPIYTYRCPECDKTITGLYKMNGDAPFCKPCSKPVPRHYVKMERIILLTNKPQFKGSGFYETDYKKKPDENKDEM